jgi:hypothetical protein
MREIFYTDSQITEAYNVWAPRLREYAALCRLKDPLPDYDSLSAADREQYRILRSALVEFRDSPIYVRDPYLNVYHGSPITLLAASEVFDPGEPSIVLLLSDEWRRWLKEVFRGADGWFGSCWVTIHDQLPQRLAADVAAYFPKSDGSCHWLLTKARAGHAVHDLWKWDGTTAIPVGRFLEQLTEEGFIDEFDC